MKDETRIWIEYAEENFKSAKILLKSKLFNPCLQNIQQSIEKPLKFVLVENSIGLKRTHHISDLKHTLEENNFTVMMTDDDCDFIDSIYLHPKYPLLSVLPDFEPNEEICNKGILLAEKVLRQVKRVII